MDYYAPLEKNTVITCTRLLQVCWLSILRKEENAAQLQVPYISMNLRSSILNPSFLLITVLSNVPVMDINLSHLYSTTSLLLSTFLNRRTTSKEDT